MSQEKLLQAAEKINDALLSGLPVYVARTDSVINIKSILRHKFGLEVELKEQYAWEVKQPFVGSKLFKERALIGYHIKLISKPDLQGRIDRIKAIGFDVNWKRMEIAQHIANYMPPSFFTGNVIKMADMGWVTMPSGGGTSFTIDHNYLANMEKEREDDLNLTFED